MGATGDGKVCLRAKPIRQWLREVAMLECLAARHDGSSTRERDA
jgi:hypothetical protein